MYGADIFRVAFINHQTSVIIAEEHIRVFARHEPHGEKSSHLPCFSVYSVVKSALRFLPPKP